MRERPRASRARPGSIPGEPPASQKTIGALLFEGFGATSTPSDHLKHGASSHRRTAGGLSRLRAMCGSVASAQGPRAVADHSLVDCPKLDAVLVPGGIGTRREVSNGALLEWLRLRSSTAEVMTSVCTGAALPRTGWLCWTGAPRDDGTRRPSAGSSSKVRPFNGSNRRAGSRTAHSSHPQGSLPGST